MKNIQNKKEKQKEKSNNRGVAVLFAVLVAVLMVSIATTMASIATRQTILSSTGRDSQYAMFAANTALECALFWDLNYDYAVDFAKDTDKVFPNPSLSETRDPNIASKDIKCNKGHIITGAGFEGAEPWDDSLSTETRFYIELKPTGGAGRYCASAIVKKSMSGTTAVTVIEARGYNTCDLTSPRAIERGLELSYTS